MILQSKGGCFLTEAADVKIEERHFVNTVHVTCADDVARWREVTEAEKEAMLRRGPVLDISRLSSGYLDEVDRLLDGIPEEINSVSLTSAEALAHKKYYPVWGDKGAPVGKEAGQGFRFNFGGVLYEVVRAHALQADLTPGPGTESLYKAMGAEHGGTEDDPVPYSGDMELENGKRYTQGGKAYLCVRDTGAPVRSPLAVLAGLYVQAEEAAEAEGEAAGGTAEETADTSGETTDETAAEAAEEAADAAETAEEAAE